MKKMYCMYFHAGSKNHGCEAIVRSTCKLLNIKPWILSFAAAEDYEYAIDNIANICSKEKIKLSFAEKAFSYISVHFFKSERYSYHLRAQHEIKKIPSGCIAMSVGGDNYCYGKAYNYYLEGFNKAFHKKQSKTILWGCSIEPFIVSKAMRKDFSKYDLIVARESISYEYLKECNPNTILACDPAFTLEAEDNHISEIISKDHYIGINISPLIQKYETEKGITLKNYVVMMNYILKNTNYKIALIPHVICKDNDDRIPLSILFEKFKDTGRVLMVPDMTCRELKAVISKCIMFIGARTHATIAAYSSGVPTLAIGYSTKARGIARDLFGFEEHYVLAVQFLHDRKDMLRAFLWLNENRNQIKERLLHVLPAYIKTISDAALIINKM